VTAAATATATATATQDNEPTQHGGHLRSSAGSAGGSRKDHPHYFPGDVPGFGAGGSTSPGGAGAVAVDGDAYKLAAPAQTGPRMPTPTLGRSVAFLDPFERPG
jgi:hypothetical protein